MQRTELLIIAALFACNTDPGREAVIDPSEDTWQVKQLRSGYFYADGDDLVSTHLYSLPNSFESESTEAVWLNSFEITSAWMHFGKIEPQTPSISLSETEFNAEIFLTATAQITTANGITQTVLSPAVGEFIQDSESCNEMKYSGIIAPLPVTLDIEPNLAFKGGRYISSCNNSNSCVILSCLVDFGSNYIVTGQLYESAVDFQLVFEFAGRQIYQVKGTLYAVDNTEAPHMYCDSVGFADTIPACEILE